MASAVTIVGILAMALALILYGHPWWAALFVVLAAGVRAGE